MQERWEHFIKGEFVPPNGGEYIETKNPAVELRPGAVLDAEAVIAHCKAELGSVKAPKSVDFAAELPRSSIGKILKRELRKQYWQDRDRQV